MNYLKVNHTVFIGSGALENAWLPVYRAIQRASGHNVNDPETANLYMASLVFRPRYHRDYLEKCRPHEIEIQRNQLQKTTVKLRDFKRILAEELRRSTVDKEIILRSEQADLIRSTLI